MATTRLSDVIIPEIFLPYVNRYTVQKSALIQSGALVPEERLDNLLTGAGSTFSEPFFGDLGNDESNVSTDDPNQLSEPLKIATGAEIQARLSRNQSWSSMDLVADLIGTDPMDRIAQRVGAYWARELQRIFIATMTGVFADNAKAPTGNEHTQNDMTYNANPTNGAYQANVNDFSIKGFTNAALTMGDAMGELSLAMVHSVIFARMVDLKMLTMWIDPTNPTAGEIPLFMGRRVIVDDAMTVQNGHFHTWLFGAGAARLGQGVPKTPVAVERNERAGNGGGQETLHSRKEFIVHPVGHAFKGTATAGGPSNANTTGNLAHEDSWQRVFPERKQIRIARLITREF